MNGFHIFFGDDALLGEHSGMRARAANILGGEALVKINRDVNRLHQLTWGCVESSAPHLLAFTGFLVRSLGHVFIVFL